MPSGQRVVVLGASNVALGFPLVVEGLRAGWDGPLDLLAAVGHGRSYGTWSRVLFRELPGVIECGLWSDPRLTESSRPLKALVTDIGNDLLYGAPVPQIIEWLDVCLRRLAERSAETVLTLLPLASVETLSQWRYRTFLAIFYPSRRGTPLPLILGMARQLNDEVRRLAERYQVRLVEPPAAWYGLDPIHIRRAHRAEAWRHIFAHWSDYSAAAPLRRPSFPKAIRYWRLPPAERRLFGRRQTAPQPAWQQDELTIALY